MSSPAGTASATVTSKTGPGLSVTAIALPNITKIVINIAAGTFEVFYGANLIGYFDYTQNTTFTDTISGTTSTFVMS